MSNYMVCTVCQREPLATQPEHDRQVCNGCSTKLGIVAMPPSMRPPRPCLHCGQRSFIRAIPRELTVEPTRTKIMGIENPAQHAPMFVTYEPTLSEPLLSAGKNVGELDPYRGRGPLEMYVCRTCGFIEWFCFTPGYIPIGPQYMTQVIEYPAPAETPYR